MKYRPDTIRYRRKWDVEIGSLLFTAGKRSLPSETNYKKNRSGRNRKQRDRKYISRTSRRMSPPSPNPYIGKPREIRVTFFTNTVCARVFDRPKSRTVRSYSNVPTRESIKRFANCRSALTHVVVDTLVGLAWRIWPIEYTVNNDGLGSWIIPARAFLSRT